MIERKVDVAIIGAGSAGLYALGKVRPSGKSFVLINGGEPGTTCARVGCMPSKVLIQVAEDFHRRNVFSRYGIEGHEELYLSIPEAMEHVQNLRDIFVERVLSNSTDKLPEENFIQGYARFVETNLLEIDSGERIRAEHIIIATGSRPLVPRAWASFRDRIITTDEFFELEDLPRSVAVIGLGVIGLEIGQSLRRMGLEVTGIDQLMTIGGLSDPVVAKTAIEVIGKEMPLWLGHAAEVSEAGDEGRIAGHNAISAEPMAFRRKTPLSITFCDPNIVVVGTRFSDLGPASTATGQIQMGAVGRAMIMAKNRGMIRVYADKASGRLLGAEMACPKGENLGHLLAWCIQQEMTVGEILQMPFYHPVIEEALQAALYDLYDKVDVKNSTPITGLLPLCVSAQ